MRRESYRRPGTNFDPDRVVPASGYLRISPYVYTYTCARTLHRTCIGRVRVIGYPPSETIGDGLKNLSKRASLGILDPGRSRDLPPRGRSVNPEDPNKCRVSSASFQVNSRISLLAGRAILRIGINCLPRGCTHKNQATREISLTDLSSSSNRIFMGATRPTLNPSEDSPCLKRVSG